MLSQEKAIDPDTDWKKQYVQSLKELDVKEKEWEQQQQELLKTVLRLTFAYQGSNDILDKKLFDLKETLKQSGNNLPQEEIEQIVNKLTLDFLPLPPDDPKIRKPDIQLARTELDWEPIIDLKDGLKDTYNYFLKELKIN